MDKAWICRHVENREKPNKLLLSREDGVRRRGRPTRGRRMQKIRKSGSKVSVNLYNWLPTPKSQPIENLWEELSRHILREPWKNIENIQKLLRSMPKS